MHYLLLNIRLVRDIYLDATQVTIMKNYYR